MRKYLIIIYRFSPIDPQNIYPQVTVTSPMYTIFSQGYGHSYTSSSPGYGHITHLHHIFPRLRAHPPPHGEREGDDHRLHHLRHARVPALHGQHGRYPREEHQVALRSRLRLLQTAPRRVRRGGRLANCGISIDVSSVSL